MRQKPVCHGWVGISRAYRKTARASFLRRHPAGLRSFLHNIANQALPGFAVSAEATHHGPVDLKTPCFFAEIGSTLKEWQDRQAGEAVARAILALETKELPVFLGFGGGHYVARQTELMFKAAVAFGHLFSNYQMAGVNRDLVEEACQQIESYLCLS